MKYIRQFFWMSMLSGLALAFTNFMSPESVRQDLIKRMSASESVRMAQPTPPNPGQPQVYMLNGKKYVLIDQRWYELKDNNVYDVKGVKTLYINNKQAPQEKVSLGAVTGSAIEELNQMIKSSPQSVYLPGGMQALMRGLEEAKKGLEERNKALEQLSE